MASTQKGCVFNVNQYYSHVQQMYEAALNFASLYRCFLYFNWEKLNNLKSSN